MKAHWKQVDIKGEYHVWKSRDGVYQLTKGATPPDTTAGYHSLESLLKLKGIKK